MKKIGVVFSGFGEQFVGMAKRVYDDSRLVQEYFEEAYNCLGINFVKLCFASSDEELSKIENAYLANFLANISLYTLLGEINVQPNVVAGHGMGRYSALFVAGGFSLPDALYLQNKYIGYYLDFLANNKVKVLKIDGIALRKLRAMCKDIGEGLHVTINNSKTSQVVSGYAKDIKKLEKVLQQLAIEEPVIFKEILPGMGMNSEMLSSMIDQFKIYLEKVDFKDLQVPFISNLNGKEVTTGKMVKKEIVDQSLNTIMWHKVVQSLADCDVIIEVGPGKTLAAGIAAEYPDKQVLTLNKKADIDSVVEALGLKAEEQGEQDAE